MKERALLGAFVSFVEAGTEVDGIIADAETVAAVTGPPAVAGRGRPDDSPTSNWPDLGAIENAKFAVKESNETFLTPNRSGDYDEEEDDWVRADMLDLKTNHMSEPAYRLLFGLPSVIVPGTAQEAHSSRARKIKGWLKVSMIEGGGDERVLMYWWCELRLKDAPDVTDKTMRPTFTVKKLRSSLNEANFPVAA